MRYDAFKRFLTTIYRGQLRELHVFVTIPLVNPRNLMIHTTAKSLQSANPVSPVQDVYLMNARRSWCSENAAFLNTNVLPPGNTNPCMAETGMVSS